MKKYTQLSIGRENAIALAKTKWWKAEKSRDIAMFQMFTKELAMDFGDFQQAMEITLGRPVFTHEFALNFDGLTDELLGKKSAPTLDEIIELIPAEKRVVVSL